MHSCTARTLGNLSISEIQMKMERAAQNKLDVMNRMKTLRPKFGGKYIAFDKGKVLAAAESLDEIIKTLKKLKIDDTSVVAVEFIPKEALAWIL